MKTNSSVILAVIVTIAVLVGVNETIKSAKRTAALEELNGSWSSMKTDQQRIAAVTRANTIIGQNKSMFGIFFSSADEGNPGGESMPGGEDEPPLMEEGGPLPWVPQRDGTVDTSENYDVYYNPQSGQWEDDWGK